MKKILAVLMAIQIFLPALVGYAQSNIIENGGFSDGFTGWSQKNGSVIEVEDGNSFMHHHVDGGTVYMEKSVSVQSEKNYLLTFRYKVDRIHTTDKAMAVSVKGFPGAIESKELSDDWQYGLINFNSGTKTSIDIAIYTGPDAGVGYDDFELKEIPAGEVINGDFTYGISPWSNPNGAVAENGQLHTFNQSSGVYLENKIIVEKNTDYVLYFDYKADLLGINGSEERAFEVQLRGGLKTGSIIQKTLTDAWETGIIEVNSGDSTNLIIAVYTDKDADVWYDNFVLVKKAHKPSLVPEKCSPANGASEVPVDNKISLTFDDYIDWENAAQNIDIVSLISGEKMDFTLNKTGAYTAELIPVKPFDFNTDYEIIISGEIKNLAGNKAEQSEIIKFTAEHNLFDMWSIEIKDENGSDFDINTAKKASVTAEFKNKTDDGKRVTLVAGLYKNDTMLSAVSTSRFITKSDGLMPVNVQISIDENIIREGMYISVYVFDNLSDFEVLNDGISTTVPGKLQETVGATGVGIKNAEYENGHTVVSGMAEGKGKKYLAVFFKQNKAIVDLPSGNFENADISDVIDYIGTQITNESGEFLFTYKKEDTSGNYEYFVKAKTGTEKYSGNYEHFSEVDISAALGRILGAETSAGLKNLLSENIKYAVDGFVEQKTNLQILGIEDTRYKNTDSLLVCEIIKNNSIADEKAFKTVFNNAVALAELSSCQTEQQLVDAIENNKTLIDVTKYRTYARYSGSAYKSDVIRRLLNRKYMSEGDFEYTFNEAVILSAVKNVVNKTEIESILSDYAAVKNIQLTDYNALGSNKNYVNVGLAGNSYNDFTTFQTRLVNLINEAKQFSTNNSTSPGGGTGGSGTIMPPLKNNSDTVKEIYKNTFSDLDNFAWAVKYIDIVAKAGIMQGDGNHLFNPGNNIKREEFAKVLTDTFELQLQEEVTNFDDVRPGEWYSKYVDILCSNGITQGIGDGKFGTGMEISRQDLCVMVYKCLKNNDISGDTETGFTDDENIAEYAKESVYAMQTCGVISGYENGEFRPENSCTRAEIAVIICNILNLLK